MWSASDAQTAAWRHVAGLVTEKHPDIKVELRTTTFLDYWTKLPTLAASGQLTDIVSLQALRTAGFSHIMEPLDPFIAKTGFDINAFEPSIISALSKGGQLFALPYDFGPLIVYYNRDLFEAANVPLPKPGWTQAEFLSAARALTRDGRHGFATASMTYIPFALSAGADYLGPTGELDLANPKLVAAFQGFADLVHKEQVAPLVPASGTASGTIASGRFTAGNVAMFVQGPWELINQKNNAKFKIGVAPIPAGAAGSISPSNGSGFGIAKSSRNKDLAWKAVQVLTGPEALAYLAQQGRALPARKAEQRYWFETAAKDVTGAQETLAAAFQTAVPYRSTPNWSNVERLHEQHAPVAFAGTQPAAEVLKTIQTLASE
jgi:ABC-type glycerol-3-phosphate transport system substrate-binding protein